MPVVWITRYGVCVCVRACVPCVHTCMRVCVCAWCRLQGMCVCVRGVDYNVCVCACVCACVRAYEVAECRCCSPCFVLVYVPFQFQCFSTFINLLASVGSSVL